MKSLTVRLTDALVAQLAAESRQRGVSRSDVVRERLDPAVRSSQPRSAFDSIADLVGSVDHLPADLSARKKEHLESTGYGRKRSR